MPVAVTNAKVMGKNTHSIIMPTLLNRLTFAKHRQKPVKEAQGKYAQPAATASFCQVPQLTVDSFEADTPNTNINDSANNAKNIIETIFKYFLENVFLSITKE